MRWEIKDCHVTSHRGKYNPSPSDTHTFLNSALMLTIHAPDMSVGLHANPSLSCAHSYILITRRYYFNLISGTFFLNISHTFVVPLILSFLIPSSCVAPSIHLSILISVSCAFCTVHLSIPSAIYGLTTVLYSFS